MKTENGVAIKKRPFRFALLYIVSIVLLAIIFTTLWNTFMSPAPASYQDESTGTSEEAELLNQDELLHEGLKKLQLLDNQFALLIADSANKQTLDSLNALISNAETSFSNTIDSIDSQNSALTNSTNVAKLDSITSAFRIALNNSRSIGYMRKALSGENGNVNENKRELLKLQMQLQSKDSKILALEDQVKIAQKKPADNSDDAGNQEEIETLHSDIKKGNEKISSLVAVNNSLTKDNSNLTAQLGELKSSTSASEEQKTTERTKNVLLQNKIDDLNANLILAKVDCNLTRADAKQIISNSNQRKDLLLEALNALNNLSHAGNSNTQNKVKEKLSQLQRIISTIRD